MINVTIIFAGQTIVYRVVAVVTDPAIPTVTRVCVYPIFTYSTILTWRGFALINLRFTVLASPADYTDTLIGIQYGRWHVVHFTGGTIHTRAGATNFC